MRPGWWFHLYLILDLYSRKVVGWEVHDSDDSNHAVHLVRRTALAEGIACMPDKPVLHGDNGSTLKATNVLAMLNWLGVKPSYSRPRVSDDNAYVLRACFVRPNTVRNSRPRDLPTSMRRVPGPRRSCTGTTLITATAAFATSVQRSVTQETTMPS